MRTVIVFVIGVSSVFLVVMIQSAINTETRQREGIKDALATAMSQTMSEVMEQNRYGIENRNEAMAAFLQAMICKLDDDVELTVKIRYLDDESGEMEVEAVGEYDMPGNQRKSVSVRRRIAM